MSNTELLKRNTVGAKHSGDNLCNSTKIKLSECFALSWLVCGGGRSIWIKHLWWVAQFIAQMLRPYISEEVQIFEGDRTLAKLIGKLQPQSKPRQLGSAIVTLTIVSEDETYWEDFQH
jgi:hypothetical protein